jgi:PIN domain nuclease of toxin-antitoxin system
MKVLVDTCAFLWIASDSPRLSKTAAAIFLDRNNQRYLSAASAWEIGIKYAIGRLPLPDRPDIFVPAIREASGIASLGIDEEIRPPRWQTSRTPCGSVRSDAGCAGHRARDDHSYA